MCFNNPKPEMLADRETKMNQARWDLFIPFVLVLAYSFAMIGFGYYEGKRNAEYRHEKIANLRRRVEARNKQLYDWERDGI
jgi:hypothetical protein